MMIRGDSAGRLSARSVCWAFSGAGLALFFSGGCGSTSAGPREVRAECRLVKGPKTIEAISCQAAFETAGLNGEQVVIDVGLVNCEGRPLKSATGKFENERGQLSARRTLIINETTPATSEVKVTIPMGEFTLRPEDYPLWADVSLSLTSGQTLSRTRVAALWTPTGDVPPALAEAAQREMERMSGAGREPREVARRDDSRGRGAEEGARRTRSERRRDDREPEIASRTERDRSQRTQGADPRSDRTRGLQSTDERSGDVASRDGRDENGDGRGRATRTTREPASTGSGTQAPAPKGKGEPIRPAGRRDDRTQLESDRATSVPELKPAPTPTSRPAPKKTPALGEEGATGGGEVERPLALKPPRTNEASGGADAKRGEPRDSNPRAAVPDAKAPSGTPTKEGPKPTPPRGTEAGSVTSGLKQPTTMPTAAGSGRKTYRVKPGDTLQSIAREELGDESRWVEIQILNPGVKPLRPGAGRIIELPASEAGSRKAALPPKPTSQPAAPSTTRAYVVKKGDTLPIIALRMLGNANRWREIYDLNREKLSDVNELREGTELRVPRE